jgi:hypothetical protein
MKNLSPRNARTFRQICALKEDNAWTKRAWLLIDVETVYIHNQKSGEDSAGTVALSRKDFDKFVDWYNKKQKVSA